MSIIDKITFLLDGYNTRQRRSPKNRSSWSYTRPVEKTEGLPSLKKDELRKLADEIIKKKLAKKNEGVNEDTKRIFSSIDKLEKQLSATNDPMKRRKLQQRIDNLRAKLRP